MKIKHVYGNVLKLDIPLTIKIRTMESDVPTEREEPFYPDVSKGCTVILGNSYNRKIQYDATVSGNVAHIEDDGVIGIGTYKVTVKCYDEEGNPYRYMVRDIIEICDATIDAGIEAGVEFNVETYTLEGAVFVSYGGEQVQSDWAETDPEEKSFIKNKPDLTQYATKNELREVESEIPTLPDHIVTDEHYVHTDNNYTTEEKTKLAGLENYDDTNVLNLIEQTNQNFANYYTKAQTYSQSEVNQLLETQRQGQYVMVEELPTASVDTMFKIYLVPSSDPQTSNIKDEYITIDNGSEATTRYTWEKIGSTAVDLSGYSTTEEMNAAIASALASYYTKTEADALLGGKQDTISDLSTIRSGAQAGATAYQKPQGGIPVSDLALGMDNVPISGSDNFVKSGGVYSALQDKQDKQLVIEIDYTDTTLPSGTYNSIITALAAGKGVIIELTDEDSVIHNLPLTYNGVNDDGLLLFSCVAGGIDFGVEVVTNNNILVYKSNQVTSVNGQTGDVVLSIPDVSTKQDVIDSSHKLSADLVDDTNTTNKFTNATEKQTWNGKQDALVSGTNIKTVNNESILGSGNINIVTELPSNLAYTSNDNGEGIIPSDGIRAVTVTNAATMTISPDVVTVIDGAVGTAAITLQVPQDNLAHVWDILLTTDSTVAITFAMSNSATILTPSGFSIGASKAVEISVIGVGTKYYLRYGEFA